MKQLKTVFAFEFKGYAKRKSFIWLTVVLVLVMAAVLSWPRIQGAFGSGDQGDDGGVVATTAERVAFVNATQDAGALEYLNQAFTGRGYRFEEVSLTRDELESAVEAGEYESGVVLEDSLAYTRYVRNLTMNDSFDSPFVQALQARYRTLALSSLGIGEEQSNELLNAGVSANVVTTASGKDQMQNFFYTYILIFALYFAIVMYGQFVATSVAQEKSTRAMELLITSARPDSLMFGKVLGAGLAGITQLVVILGSAYLFYNLNIAYYADNYIVQSIFAMPLSILGYTIVFFVLGFFIYAFLYAALASLVSRMEDLNTAIMPVMYLFIIAFLVVMMSMASGNVDSALMVVCSYIPLTSPMAMFTRIAMGNVQGIEIIISIVILLVSTIGIGYLATAIYRLGVLLYGNPPKPKEIVRMLRAKNN